MKKSILLIGLGRFGRHVAMKLDELHHEIMAVDKEERRVEAALPYVTNAQIGDATNEAFLSSLGVSISMYVLWRSEIIFRVPWKRPPF